MRLFKKKQISKKDKPNWLSKISLFFFDRPIFSATLWLLIGIFGVLSYTLLLRREGFPQISTPYSTVAGAYLVNNSAKVDHDITGPVSQIISKMPGVSNVSATANPNFYTIVIQYKEGYDSTKGNQEVKDAVTAARILPSSASAAYQPLGIGSPNGKTDDILISFYKLDNSDSTEKLTKVAQEAAKYMQKAGHAPFAQSFAADDVFVYAPGSVIGAQKNFDRYVASSNGKTHSYNAAIIGVKGVNNFDALKLDTQLRTSIKYLLVQPAFKGYGATVSFSPAPGIKTQISQLQQSLLEGLAAVFVLSALLIAFRASFITIGAMAFVILSTLGVLYVWGYSLNTITLFSLILALTLIVDDTVIMVEAIDAQSRKSSDSRETVILATKKISRAMLAATSVAVFAFSPLIFVNGILGQFIRAIPITIITSLVVSLLIALTLIPFMARGLLLSKKQLQKNKKNESRAHLMEAFAARALAQPLRWANHNRKRLVTLGLAALFVGLGFIVAAGFIFQKVTFNIFPPSKDTNGLTVAFVYPPGTTIQRAQQLAEKADVITESTLGKNFLDSAYFNTGSATGATLRINLIPYNKRSITAPVLKAQLQQQFDRKLREVAADVELEDVAGPAGNFSVRILTDDRAQGFAFANDLKSYLSSVNLKRPSGVSSRFKSVTISDPSIYYRADGKGYIAVTGLFKDSDTTTLDNLAQAAVTAHYSNADLAKYGLKRSQINYYLGFEGQNQNSFKVLLYAFPVVLLVIYLLLILQFRSLVQPLLIFIAIPFSLFGISLGLYLSNNAFSFFGLLGFFALLGLSIKNTILLTDYANQARRQGFQPVESMALALEQRFRPLVATSIIAIISLTPLALTNPFWQSLAVTLMGGLLSSTILVLVAFPYYYLGVEFLRIRTARFFKKKFSKKS